MPIVDTSCFIALIRIGELRFLRKLFLKVTVTPEIVAEMNEGVEGVSEFRAVLDNWILVRKPKAAQSISMLSSAESITLADASLIVLALEQNDFLVSNDAALIRAARIKGVTCWWLTSCIIEAIKKDILSKKQAREMLLSLISKGTYLENRVYAALLDEIERL